MYATNTNFPEGFLCFVGEKLIFRPNIPEKTNVEKFAEVINTDTLMVGNGTLFVNVCIVTLCSGTDCSISVCTSITCDFIQL